MNVLFTNALLNFESICNTLGTITNTRCYNKTVTDELTVPYHNLTLHDNLRWRKGNSSYGINRTKVMISYSTTDK